MLERFYAECVEGFMGEFSKAIRRGVTDHEILRKIRTVTFAHGMKMTATDIEGTSRQSEMKRLAASFKISRSVLEMGDGDAFRQSVKASAEELMKESINLLFSSLSDLCDETGNVVDCGGKPITDEKIYEIYEKMEFSFDKEGQPILPQIVVSPEVERQVRELLDNPQVRGRIEEIIRKKWMDKYTLWNLAHDTP